MERGFNKDLPSIRQTVFIVDKYRRYMFDVNQNITIYCLKKMLVAAANLGKVGLRLFHDEIEYTDKDTCSLDTLFPDLQRVEFTLQICYTNIEDFDPLIKMKLDYSYCPRHEGKYLYYYCYDCQRSLCPICAKEPLHDRHNIKEKFDCFQSSKTLIDDLFNDLKVNVDLTNQKSIDQLRANIKLKFYNLVEVVKKIEAQLLGLIDDFLAKEKENIVIIRNNAQLLKNHCADGLEQLKGRLNIEDMMLDEEIFLIFDQKINSIRGEKDRFEADVQRYQQYTGQFEIISSEVERINAEIYAFLQKYLERTLYNDILRTLQEFSIKPLEKSPIVNRILSDIKKLPRKLQSSQKKGMRPDYQPDFESGKKYQNQYEPAYNQHGQGQGHQHQYEPERDHAYKQGQGQGHHHEHDHQYQPHQHQTGEQHDHSYIHTVIPMGIEKNINSLFPVRQINFNPSIKPTIIEETVQTTIPVNPNDIFISQIIEDSSEVIIYSKQSNSINRKTITPSLYSTLIFNTNSAWFNHKNKLYISGGVDCNGDSSTLFIEYDPITNKYIRLTDLPEPRHSHSMYIEHDSIFIIGGSTNTCVEYSLKTYEFTTIGSLTQRRYNPVLFKKESVIYALFGHDDAGNKLSNFERRVGDKGSKKWEMIEFKGEKGVKMYGCGIIPSLPSEIYLLGGFTDNGITSAVYLFNLETNALSKTTFVLKEGAFFKQSLLPSLGDPLYGNFTLENKTPFFQIRFG